MKQFMTLVSVSFLLSTTVLADQYCNESIDRSAPGGRFVILPGAEAVLDVVTNMVWQRCPLGYSLSDNGTPDRVDDDRCRPGSAFTFTWQAALQAAAELDAGENFWRLPNVKELNSLVESGCAWPAIAETIFPDTVPGAFWSSTPNSPDLARSVNFAIGQVTTTVRTTEIHVRLVSERPIGAAQPAP